MNGTSHYLVGLIITLEVLRFRKNSMKDGDLTRGTIVIICVLAFFSHILVDALARFTYHPSSSNWGDPIYTLWHITIYTTEAVSAIYFLKKDIRYVYGMISAVGFDLWDWSIRRPLQKYFNVNTLPSLHWMADWAEEFLFGWLPSFRQQQWAVLGEIIFMLICFLIWRSWHKTSLLAIDPHPATTKQVLLLILTIGTLRILTLV